MQPISSLPIDPFIPELILACTSFASTIVKAEPGAGKTTRLPRALLDATAGRILVLEPRRLAARLSAERVAQEMGESVGQTVGYHMRFAAAFGPNTRLIYMTEGLFLRLLQDNPQLDDISAVILDEFHERHIHCDVALAIILKLQRSTRPDLRLIVMSATIDTELLSRHLSPAQVYDIPGRTYPIAIEYRPSPAQTPLEEQVLRATQTLVHDTRCQGNILVFLSGIAEIRRCAEYLAPLGRSHDIDIYGLTAEIPLNEQNKIFAPRDRRMIVLATNVAETSVTLPGITGVIDSGRAKIAGMASWSGMPTLDLKPISQASAIQRSGRAGRTAPGVAYRLFSEGDFLGRPPFLSPEIQRLDLTALCLEILTLRERWGESTGDLQDSLPWLEKPDARRVSKAIELLRNLGALAPNGHPTPDGRRMASLPLHPRLAKIALVGEYRGCTDDALLVTCLLSEGPITDSHSGPRSQEISLWQQLQFLKRELGKTPNLSLDATFQSALSRPRISQIAKLFHALRRQIPSDTTNLPLDESHLGSLLLAGFPDRVGKLRPPSKDLRPTGKEGLSYNLVTGGGGSLMPQSAAKGSPWILAIEAEESTTRHADQAVLIRTAIPIDPADLTKAASPFLIQKKEAVWADEAQRVDVLHRFLYGPLIIEESRLAISEDDREIIHECLLQKLKEYWPKPFVDDSDLVTYHKRVAVLRSKTDAQLPIFTDEMLELLMADICDSKRSFKEISDKTLKDYIDDQLSWDEKSRLDRDLPLKIQLENGRNFPVFYETDRPPFIAGYIQDFFGVKRSPALLGGLVPLTLELRGPNKRPVQVTGDLIGFWSQVYPKLRSELSRNYPKHYWPDVPQDAEPHLHKSRASKITT
jgi:ATP-dependent helicase HrpB